jgi:hypothetical protein
MDDQRCSFFILRFNESMVQPIEKQTERYPEIYHVLVRLIDHAKDSCNPSAVFGNAAYVRRWFENMYRDSGVFSVFYNAALSFLCTFFICVLKKWYWKLVPFFIYFTCDAILLHSGIIFFSGGWNIYYLMLVRVLCLTLFMALKNNTPINLRSSVPNQTK